METKKESHFRKVLRAYPIAILSLIDAIMVLVPTYMENFFPNIYDNINMKQDQFTRGLIWYGLFAMVSNIMGMYIGGKFKGKNLILTSLLLQLVALIWYASLMFQGSRIDKESTQYGVSNMIQWILILFIYAFAISGLIWGTLWRIIKNYGTQKLEAKEKEKKVGENNGISGFYQGIIGFVIGLAGVFLTWLSKKGIMPKIEIFGTEVNAGFIGVLLIIFILTIASSLLTMYFIKEEEDQRQTSFSLSNLGQIAKNWKLWCLALMLLGIFMLQMELSAYVNYLSNIFVVTPIVVMISGLVRTYLLRFLLANYVGKKGDKAHSYIFILLLGIFVGILLIIVGIVLPGFGEYHDELGTIKHLSPFPKFLLQVAGILNLFVLGSITWTLVTLRWSPIGVELKISNENYASAVAFLSTIAYSPGIYFKWIKSAIEKKYQHTVLDENMKEVFRVDRTGNQLILLTCACFAMIGLIAGLILYINLYRESAKYAFKIFKKQTKAKISEKND